MKNGWDHRNAPVVSRLSCTPRCRLTCQDAPVLELKQGEPELPEKALRRKSWHRLAVAPLHLAGIREEEGEERRDGLQRHEDEVRLRLEAAWTVNIDVEPEVDGAADNGCELVSAHSRHPAVLYIRRTHVEQALPDSQEPPLLVWLRVRHDDCALGHPEDAARGPADDGPEHEKPLVGKGGVRVQRRGVRCISRGADGEADARAELGDEAGWA